MRAVARLLRSRRAELAQLPTLEMGKPIVESEAEGDKCAWGCDYYAENGARFLASEEIATNARLSMVEYRPLPHVLNS